MDLYLNVCAVVTDTGTNLLHLMVLCIKTKKTLTLHHLAKYARNAIEHGSGYLDGTSVY
jgi:hypothetical protein